MFDFECDGKTVSCDVTAYTMALYQMEFGEDIISDVFGKVRLDTDSDSDTTIDYSETNWTALPQALWACAKTVDDTLPRYKDWSKRVKGLNLFFLKSDLERALVDGFFRLGAADSE